MLFLHLFLWLFLLWLLLHAEFLVSSQCVIFERSPNSPHVRKIYTLLGFIYKGPDFATDIVQCHDDWAFECNQRRSVTGVKLMPSAFLKSASSCGLYIPMRSLRPAHSHVEAEVGGREGLLPFFAHYRQVLYRGYIGVI